MANIIVHQDDSGVLRATFSSTGETYQIKPIRCFPLSASGRQVALFRVGPGGKPDKEIIILSDYSGIDENGRRLIEEALDKNHVLTPITRIWSIKQAERGTRWLVETDKGKVAFDMRDLKDIFEIHPSGIIITDSKGSRYRIDTA